MRAGFLLAAIAMVLMVGTAAPCAESGDGILAQIKAVNDARRPTDEVQHAHMTIVDSSGFTRDRTLLLYTKNFEARAAKSIIFFLTPPDLRGVGVLSWIHPDRDDDSWIYFPATERIRRLSTGLADQDFGDSDFTNRDSKLLADLLNESTKVGSAKLIGSNESVDGVACVLIDFYPAHSDTNYGLLRMWLDRGDSTLRKMDFFALDQRTLIKRMSLTDYQTISNIPTAGQVEMTTIARGTHTTMKFTETLFNQGLSDSLFTQKALTIGPPSQ